MTENTPATLTETERRIAIDAISTFNLDVSRGRKERPAFALPGSVYEKLSLSLPEGADPPETRDYYFTEKGQRFLAAALREMAKELRGNGIHENYVHSIEGKTGEQVAEIAEEAGDNIDIPTPSAGRRRPPKAKRHP